ncbi:hypothetical protein TNCV_3840761 [Trichonephila clavipes]|nr:hypothetical protein TNCV_3840761 [Trichonephila clavipes]
MGFVILNLRGSDEDDTGAAPSFPNYHTHGRTLRLDRINIHGGSSETPGLELETITPRLPRPLNHYWRSLYNADID